MDWLRLARLFNSLLLLLLLRLISLLLLLLLLLLLKRHDLLSPTIVTLLIGVPEEDLESFTENGLQPCILNASAGDLVL